MNPTERDLLISLHEKLDGVRDDITDLKVISTKQELNLQEHMKRTDLLEEQQDIFKEEITPILQGAQFFKTFAKCVFWCATILKAVSIFFR